MNSAMWTSIAARAAIAPRAALVVAWALGAGCSRDDATDPAAVPAAATASASDELWRSVAQSTAIVRGILHVDVEAMVRTISAGGGYITMEIEPLETLKGSELPHPLPVRCFVKAARPGLSTRMIQELDGRDVLLSAVYSGAAGEPAWFLTDESTECLAPFSPDMADRIRAEVHRQRDMVARIPPISTAEERAMDEQVARIIERMLDKSTASQAYKDLEALGRPAVPFIIRRMDDHRVLAVRYIELENPPSCFEAHRIYSPHLVIDVLEQILNQITGEHFGSLGSSSSDRERTLVVEGWKVYLARLGPP